MLCNMYVISSVDSPFYLPHPMNTVMGPLCTIIMTVIDNTLIHFKVSHFHHLLHGFPPTFLFIVWGCSGLLSCWRLFPYIADTKLPPLSPVPNAHMHMFLPPSLLLSWCTVYSFGGKFASPIFIISSIPCVPASTISRHKSVGVL